VHFEDFPLVSPKTVFNFVIWICKHYHIAKTSIAREYEMAEELPYGKQAQADFGEYNMRDGQGERIKVFFFTMVLSRSRFKYVLSYTYSIGGRRYLPYDLLDWKHITNCTGRKETCVHKNNFLFNPFFI